MSVRSPPMSPSRLARDEPNMPVKNPGSEFAGAAPESAACAIPIGAPSATASARIERAEPAPTDTVSNLFDTEPLLRSRTEAQGCIASHSQLQFKCEWLVVV